MATVLLMLTSQSVSYSFRPAFFLVDLDTSQPHDSDQSLSDCHDQFSTDEMSIKASATVFQVEFQFR